MQVVSMEKRTRDLGEQMARLEALGKMKKNPGACVSVVQLESAQEGLIPRQKGNLTRDRIVGATVFVHLMRSLSGEETLEVKQAFQRHALTINVTMCSYRADNGRFGEKMFKKDCDEKDQTITVFAVGAHHQNGIAERSIEDLSETARTLLLYSMRMWPEMVTAMLWPFALRHAAARRNRLVTDCQGYTSIERFSQTHLPVNASIFHTWASPVYVLDSRGQSDSKIPKWEPRSRLGINLGFSPFHASSVSLVLNPHTGLVSPQFHIFYDDDFSTLPFFRSCQEPPHRSRLVRLNSHLATDEPYDWTLNWHTGPTPPSEDDSPPSSLADEGEIATMGSPTESPLTEINSDEIIQNSEGAVNEGIPES